MLRGLCLPPWSKQGLCVGAVLLTVAQTSCLSATKPENSPASSFQSQPQAASPPARLSTGKQDSPRHIVLPNPALIGCRTGNCTRVLPDKAAGNDAVHPWQVSVDFTGDEVIGLTALYDQPTTIDDLQVAVDERYGKWAEARFRTGPVRIWRVEPEKFVIQLGVTDGGMIQLIYLIFDAKHPMSDRAEKYMYCAMEKAVNCAASRRSNSWVPDFLR